LNPAPGPARTADIRCTDQLLQVQAIITECWPDSPFRAVDWRYRRAVHLHAGRLAYRPRDEDAWVRVAVRHLRRQTGQDAGSRSQLAALADAHRIRFDGESHKRWEIEARLLAGQDNIEIADRLGLERGAIEAYEAVYFQVRDRLGQSDYIMASVIGPAVYRGLRPDDLATIAKLYGYAYGPYFLDLLLHWLRWPGTILPPGIEAEDMIELEHSFELMIAARTLEVDQTNVLPILRLMPHVEAIKRRWLVRDHSAVTAAIAPSFKVMPVMSPTVEPSAPVVIPLGGQTETLHRDARPVIGPVDLEIEINDVIRRTG
jgi:hypothetical protein